MNLVFPQMLLERSVCYVSNCVSVLSVFPCASSTQDLQLAEANSEARTQRGCFEQMSQDKNQLEARIAVLMW